MLDQHHIDKAVVLCTVSPECRYTIVIPEEILRLCSQYPDRLIPFCSIDPRYLTNDTSADFRTILTTYKELGCKGIGEYIPNIPWDDPLNLNVFTQVQEVGLPLTFHIAPQMGGTYGLYDEVGLPRLEKVLGMFPNLVFIGHSQPFWAEISTDVIQHDERVSYPSGKVTPGKLLELMRTYPNLHGDLSAQSGYNAISRDPEFGDQFMEEFADRLYWATDIANDPQELPIVEYFQLLEQEKRLSTETFEKITWRNANKLLALGLTG